MIFRKRELVLNFPMTSWWAEPGFSKEFIVSNRKYFVRKENGKVFINRKQNDIYDYIGLSLFKMLDVVKGSKIDKAGQISLILNFGLSSFHEILFVFSFAALFVLIVTADFVDRGFLIMSLAFLFFVFAIQYIIFDLIIKSFRKDLVHDINYW